MTRFVDDKIEDALDFDFGPSRERRPLTSSQREGAMAIYRRWARGRGTVTAQAEVELTALLDQGLGVGEEIADGLIVRWLTVDGDVLERHMSQGRGQDGKPMVLIERRVAATDDLLVAMAASRLFSLMHPGRLSMVGSPGVCR